MARIPSMQELFSRGMSLLYEEVSRTLAMWLAFKAGKLREEQFVLPDGSTLGQVLDLAANDAFETFQIDISTDNLNEQILCGQMLHVLVGQGKETVEGAADRFVQICDDLSPEKARELFPQIYEKCIEHVVEYIGEGTVDMTAYTDEEENDEESTG